MKDALRFIVPPAIAGIISFTYGWSAPSFLFLLGLALGLALAQTPSSSVKVK